MTNIIKIGNQEIRVEYVDGVDYLCLGDIAQLQPRTSLKEYFRLASTIDFLTVWETKYNTDFEQQSFEDYKSGKLLSRLRISPTQWVKEFNGRSLIVKSARGGGVYAHRVVAIHFANWISVEFYVEFVNSYISLAGLNNQRYLKLILRKIEDNTLESYRLATDYSDLLGKIQSPKGK